MQITQNKQNQIKPRFDRLLRPHAWKRSGDYSGRKGSDGRKKKIRKANKKKIKVKRAKNEEGNGQGRKNARKGYPAPRGGQHT